MSICYPALLSLPPAPAPLSEVFSDTAASLGLLCMVCCLCSVVYGPLYTFCGVLSLFCCLWSMVCYLRSFVYGLFSRVCCHWSVVYGLLSGQLPVIGCLLSMVCCLQSAVSNISAGEPTASRPRLTSHDTPTGGRILDLPRSRMQGVVTRLHGAGQLPGRGSSLGNLVCCMYMVCCEWSVVCDLLGNVVTWYYHLGITKLNLVS